MKIKPIDNKKAKQFMKENHYTRSCAKSTIAYQFTENDELIGMIVFGQPS